MIIEPENKKPTVTLDLLNNLKGRVTNPSLREEIIKTLSEIVRLTSQQPTNHYQSLVQACPSALLRFGRTTQQSYSARDSVRQKFTGYEADAESGLNFAQARYPLKDTMVNRGFECLSQPRHNGVLKVEIV
jgi:hypothetical protein